MQQGEVLGIIGRNGAGKSTLLKILSRITAPTEGKVKVKGRIASLLEVGTGFHPELTGRENIYLNGAILGMNRSEITRKFDEIVDFAEIEKFIDTPVKRYSSGMYVRLAFAVAAHLEPEILVVDEVLAVGDAEFQKKCLGKMGEVASGGRTILFVSHNMASINQLCDRSLLIHKGTLYLQGSTATVVEQYIAGDQELIGEAIIQTDRLESRSGTGIGKILKIEILNQNGSYTNNFGIGEPIEIRIVIKTIQRLPSVSWGIEIISSMGVQIANLHSDSQGLKLGPYEVNEEETLILKIPGLPLYPGVYGIRPWFAEKGGSRVDYLYEGIPLRIESKGIFESEKMIQTGRGFLIMDCVWQDNRYKQNYENPS